MAEANIETLRAAKVGKMVSICPHCVRTIGTDWREYGAAFQIEHHSELLARLGDAPAGRAGLAGKAWSSTIPATWAVIATSTTSRAA